MSAWGFSGLTGKMSQSVSNKYCVDVSGDNLDREHEEQGRHQPVLTLLPRDKWTDNALINWSTSPRPSHDQQRQCTGVRAQYWVHSIHSSSSRQMSVLLLHNYHVICLTVIFAMKFSTSVSGSLGSWQLAGCLAKVEMLWLVSLSLCVTCDVTSVPHCRASCLT